ncbi:MAG: hypothetical protein U9Q67_02720, partial [Patescibacteria group bacterium]|nr:hypothetical protein [Patescibacteria group bacterium]
QPPQPPATPASTLSPQSPATPASSQPPQSPVSPDPSAHLTDKVNPGDLASKWRRTKCLNCNYVYEGTKTLTVCPKCGNSDTDKFQEAD